MNKQAKIIMICILGISFQLKAQGNLLITPTRVVFENNKQKEELNLLNMGKDSATYSISFIQKRMKVDGSFINIEKPDSGQMFADPFLKIYPRQVTLAPGESQVIILQYRLKEGMADGEYRSHLYFRSEKDYSPLGMNKSIKDTTLLSVQVIPIFGMSIPIIIRTGNVNVSTTLSDLKLENQQDSLLYLRFCINRTGNISTYGDIIVEFIPDQGKPVQIGNMAGVGVYTNLNKRNLLIKLNKGSLKSLQNGKIRIQYINSSVLKRNLYAEAEIANRN